MSQLTADQRRTLYSYMLYILSSAGQAKLTTKFYQSLPQALLDTMRSGFTSNY